MAVNKMTEGMRLLDIIGGKTVEQMNREVGAYSRGEEVVRNGNQEEKTCESVARFFVLGNDRRRHDLSDLSGVDMSFSVTGSL